MDRRLEYLYGDSTPSSIHRDYIALLRDTLDFATAVMIAEENAAEARARASQHAARIAEEVERAERLQNELAITLDKRIVEDGETLPARWARRVRDDLGVALRAESDTAQGVLNEEKAKAAECADEARHACKVALETLLIRQELPGAMTAATLHAHETGGYRGSWSGRTGYGLEWVTRLDVAEVPALRQALRVEQLVGPLAVHAPKMVGWFQREEKLRRQRLDRLYLRELVVDDTAAVAKLRKKPHVASAGFDLLFARDPTRVEIRRVQASGEPTGASHVVQGRDAAKLLQLRDALLVQAVSLVEHRDVLLEAKLDDTPLAALEAPRELVERLLTSLAPTVEEIARRSLVPGELVIKRVLDENHREEVFLSRAELRERLEAVPSSVRAVFAPLGLWTERRAVGESAEVTTTSSSAPPPPEGEEARASTAAHLEGDDGMSDVRPQPPGAANGRPSASMSSTGRWPALHASAK